MEKQARILSLSLSVCLCPPQSLFQNDVARSPKLPLRNFPARARCLFPPNLELIPSLQVKKKKNIKKGKERKGKEGKEPGTDVDTCGLCSEVTRGPVRSGPVRGVPLCERDRAANITIGPELVTAAACARALLTGLQLARWSCEEQFGSRAAQNVSFLFREGAKSKGTGERREGWGSCSSSLCLSSRTEGHGGDTPARLAPVDVAAAAVSEDEEEHEEDEEAHSERQVG